jgi:hypothetical protein
MAAWHAGDGTTSANPALQQVPIIKLAQEIITIVRCPTMAYRYVGATIIAVNPLHQQVHLYWLAAVNFTPAE